MDKNSLISYTLLTSNFLEITSSETANLLISCSLSLCPVSGLWDVRGAVRSKEDRSYCKYMYIFSWLVSQKPLLLSVLMHVSQWWKKYSDLLLK